MAVETASRLPMTFPAESFAPAFPALSSEAAQSQQDAVAAALAQLPPHPISKLDALLPRGRQASPVVWGEWRANEALCLGSKAAAARHMISPEQRQMVIMWMARVCESVKWSESTFYGAANLMDRFLARSPRPLSTNDLPLLSVACLYLAANNSEFQYRRLTPELADFVQTVPYLESVAQVTDMQCEIVACLGGHVLDQTPHDFLVRYLGRLKESATWREAYNALCLAAPDGTDRLAIAYLRVMAIVDAAVLTGASCETPGSELVAAALLYQVADLCPALVSSAVHADLFLKEVCLLPLVGNVNTILAQVLPPLQEKCRMSGAHALWDSAALDAAMCAKLEGHEAARHVATQRHAALLSLVQRLTGQGSACPEAPATPTACQSAAGMSLCTPAQDAPFSPASTAESAQGPAAMSTHAVAMRQVSMASVSTGAGSPQSSQGEAESPNSGQTQQQQMQQANAAQAPADAQAGGMGGPRTHLTAVEFFTVKMLREVV